MYVAVNVMMNSATRNTRNEESESILKYWTVKVCAGRLQLYAGVPLNKQTSVALPACCLRGGPPADINIEHGVLFELMQTAGPKKDVRTFLFCHTYNPTCQPASLPSCIHSQVNL